MLPSPPSTGRETQSNKPENWACFFFFFLNTGFLLKFLFKKIESFQRPALLGNHAKLLSSKLRGSGSGKWGRGCLAYTCFPFLIVEKMFALNKLKTKRKLKKKNGGNSNITHPEQTTKRALGLVRTQAHPEGHLATMITSDIYNEERNLPPVVGTYTWP